MRVVKLRRVVHDQQAARLETDVNQAPWLGLTGFFSVAVMLSLLVFVGEAVRDAFDPRRTFA